MTHAHDSIDAYTRAYCECSDCTPDLTNATVIDQHGRECTVLQDTGATNVRVRINGTNFGGWVPRDSLRTAHTNPNQQNGN